MPYTTLISPQDLLPHLHDPSWAVVDCRFALADAGQGRRDYLQSHIPGAVYAHLDEDLSGPIIKGVTGRHPLPDIDQAAAVFSRLGIGQGVQVVAYDDVGGALAAARLWWMLTWLGHDQAAVLDGGWRAWQQPGLPSSSGEEQRPAAVFTPHPRPELVVSAADVEAMRQDPDSRVIDVRAAERYQGQNETIDPVAGHIPGALNYPYAQYLGRDAAFRTPDELKMRFQELLGNVPVERTAFYCGSGVTAALGVLAMQYAGFGLPKLYAGSWSEWIAGGKRPVA